VAEEEIKERKGGEKGCSLLANFPLHPHEKKEEGRKTDILKSTDDYGTV